MMISFSILYMPSNLILKTKGFVSLFNLHNHDTGNTFTKFQFECDFKNVNVKQRKKSTKSF